MTCAVYDSSIGFCFRSSTLRSDGYLMDWCPVLLIFISVDRGDSVSYRTRRFITINIKPIYEGVSKSFRTGHLAPELQTVQLSTTRCSCFAILWVILASFAAITLCVASQAVFIIVVYFVIDSVRKLLDTPSYMPIHWVSSIHLTSPPPTPPTYTMVTWSPVIWNSGRSSFLTTGQVLLCLSQSDTSMLTDRFFVACNSNPWPQPVGMVSSYRPL
jgi:hypothetical protein